MEVVSKRGCAPVRPDDVWPVFKSISISERTFHILTAIDGDGCVMPALVRRSGSKKEAEFDLHRSCWSIRLDHVGHARHRRR